MDSKSLSLNLQFYCNNVNFCLHLPLVKSAEEF